MKETQLKGIEMIDSKRKFYYGDGTDHVVTLTENQALAISESTFEAVEGSNPLQGYLNLPDGCTIEDYNEAADILNDYHDEHGSVPWDDTSNPMLRLVEEK